jgi:uncharacterized membrane protein
MALRIRLTARATRDLEEIQIGDDELVVVHVRDGRRDAPKPREL